MIVVDSSVWVDFFKGASTVEVQRLRALFGQREVLVGDLILCEVLQGFRSDIDAAKALRLFAAFDAASMVGYDIAVKAAENYRTLRRLGVTTRKTIDVLIGTFCIENDHVLLHSDRDFDPMTEHLGLRTL